MTGSPVEIFISYSVADKAFVDRLTTDLLAHDTITWVGHINLRGGDEWAEAIEKAIDRAQVVLVIWTPAARDSKYTRKEYGYAIEQNKRVIPIILKPCKLAMLLQGLHWIDFTEESAYPDRLSTLLNLLKNSDTIPLPPQPTVSPISRISRRLMPYLLLSILFLVVVTGVGILYMSLNGAKRAASPATPTLPIALTATASATNGAGTSTLTGTAASNTTPGSGGAQATATVRAGSTSAASSPAVAPTDTPTATDTPTIAPTADPTPRFPQ